MAVGKDFKNVPAVHNRRPLLLLAVATFLAVLTITAVSYEKAGHATGVNGDPNLSDGIRIHADIQKISPTDDQLVVGLQFEPRGRFAQDGVFLAKNVRVVAVGGAGLVDESFAAGGLMTSQTLPVALETGDISQYPFDRYTSLFSVRILTTDGAPVPTVLLAGGSVHGYSIGIGNPPREPNEGNDLTISVGRAPSTWIFAVFIILLMWTLTILAMLLVANQIRSNRPIDGTLISFLGVLLFSFSAVRNSMPNAPAVGALTDYLSFFWCELILGLCVVAMLIVRIRRN
ncbi:transmembrane protein [Mycobacterium lentiflavum]|uniref:Transmembrane protein n=1 Tax=Mycobacterium lentiflavum TaxID=141349 RepID=A0A0E3WC19_MYCLN|nr:DUF4436 family protein [Mycobacterium lentiflavum]CQD11533.1 transmembrane protein [Mycobacterium lentiflavum]